jgi:hypothetical protein
LAERRDGLAAMPKNLTGLFCKLPGGVIFHANQAAF